MNEDVGFHLGGLYRCCLQYIYDYTTGASSELQPGEVAICMYCQAQMKLDNNRIWRWQKSS